MSEKPIMRCETCKHWKRNESEYGDCLGIEAQFSLDALKGEAVVSTDSAANLVTKKTFSCILWDGRGDQVDPDFAVIEPNDTPLKMYGFCKEDGDYPKLEEER